MSKVKKPLTGKRVFFYFVCFFGTVMILDTIFISFALKTHTGVVTQQAYERGLAHDELAAKTKNQLPLTTSSEITSNKIRIYIEDETGQPVENQDVSVHGMLAKNDKTDFKIPLTYIGDGWYDAALIWPQSGHWNLYFTVKTPEGKYYKKESYRFINK